MIITVAVSEVPDGKPLAVRVSDQLTLAVCRLDGSYHAFDSKCPIAVRSSPTASSPGSSSSVRCIISSSA